ncbi:hypothetical protein BDM02DRAFT_2735922 [Thelephora ganbajun]|uniref:Uncharacterized protein n=1 Tax=Thelephora ganbajun TaxID=370292 RepID=A0ACB6ZCF3_THEGA|nr:hypothetical protein BDM02DRAFT_2735922 [Thelephora ganbajun]
MSIASLRGPQEGYGDSEKECRLFTKASPENACYSTCSDIFITAQPLRPGSSSESLRAFARYTNRPQRFRLEFLFNKGKAGACLVPNRDRDTMSSITSINIWKTAFSWPFSFIELHAFADHACWTPLTTAHLRSLMSYASRRTTKRLRWSSESP